MTELPDNERGIDRQEIQAWAEKGTGTASAAEAGLIYLSRVIRQLVFAYGNPDKALPVALLGYQQVLKKIKEEKKR